MVKLRVHLKRLLKTLIIDPKHQTSFLHPLRALFSCPEFFIPSRNTRMISVLSSHEPNLLLRCMEVLLTVKISG